MKIAIISINMYTKGLNFASPLHTYAFQQFLLKNGFETTVLDYRPVYYDNFNLRHPYDYFVQKCDAYSKKHGETEEEQQLIEQKLDNFKKKSKSWKNVYDERELRYDKFQHFIDTRYVKTDFCYDSDLLEVMDPGFDCYICATDVIWKNEPNDGYDRGFFLASTAMENKWKISYAASRGTYFAKSEEDDAQFFHYLEDLDYISVREASLKEHIEQNLNKEVTMVLDPVLLHEREFYEEIAVKPPEEHYLLLYYVMEKATDTLEQAVRYAKAHDMQIVEITDLPRKNGRLKQYDFQSIFRYDIGLEEWLGYFLYADVIFTNSFHACCFSILFEKKFFAGFRHGDKVTNVLRIFHLEDRRIDADTDLIHCEPSDIDYTSVREILSQKRKESADFILSAIRDVQRRKRPEKDYTTYKQSLTYTIRYCSGQKLTYLKGAMSHSYDTSHGSLRRIDDGTLEYIPDHIVSVNDGSSHLLRNEFHFIGHTFLGWHIRFQIDNRWFWYLEDGTFKETAAYNIETDSPIRLFQDEEALPFLPVNRIRAMTAEAVWEHKLHRLLSK